MVINQHTFYFKKDIQLHMMPSTALYSDGLQIRFLCVWNQESRLYDVAGISVVVLRSHLQELRRQEGSQWGCCCSAPGSVRFEVSTHPLNADIHIQLLAPVSSTKPMSCKVHWNLQRTSLGAFPAPLLRTPFAAQAAGRCDTPAVGVSVGPQLSSEDATRTATVFPRGKRL